MYIKKENIHLLYEHINVLKCSLTSLSLPRLLPRDVLEKISEIEMEHLTQLMIDGCEMNLDCTLFCKFKLKQLRLTEIITVEAFSALAKNENLYNLTSLDLSISQSTVESIEILSNSLIFSNLTCLIMEHNHIDDEMVKILTKCKYLSKIRKLNLFANDIGNVGLLHISSCEYLRQLNHLDLRRNSFTDIGIGYLSNSSNMQNLEYLDLSRNVLSGDSAILLSNSQYLTNIKSINLTSNSLGYSCVKEISKFKQLEELKLCNNDLNQESMEIISKSFTKLKVLDLSDNPIMEGASHLQNLPNSNLIHLDLSLCKLPIKCIVDLSMSDSILNVKKLYLGFNQIGDEGVMLISSSLYNLTHLFLPFSNITSRGVKYLCDGVLDRIELLDLANNMIGNEGLTYISQCNNFSYLEYLYLDINILISDLSELLFVNGNLQNLKHISARKCMIVKLIEKSDENISLPLLEFLDISKNKFEKSELSKLMKKTSILPCTLSLVILY
ncbi:predicted protein [Naegleria gruberi]|uniref:Predicted protein n=1 Tax=Naegleria gruberi TaxID=5762 RepID=D2W339_NAEGR|nr:uncharacterized protein NAEGRDRAFT_75810 [Naegleria gruberi]EFC36514.1 predicted protein [Naegleria gruberi]|eukprot:XP_002669258.1 predicted protein [Naegleria gruberi strain NEG-M]